MTKIVAIDVKEKKQAAFIQQYVETGDCMKAALDAGYSHGEYGYQLRDKLAGEIRVAMDKRISAVAPMAMNTLAALSKEADSESVRRQASKDIMSLGGFDIQRTADVTPTDKRTDEELIESIGNLIKSSESIKQALTPYIVNE